MTTKSWRVSQVQCDRCGRGSGHVKQLALEARKLASRDGWSRAFIPGKSIHGGGSQDLCPGCKHLAAGKR